ncbi:MAG: serine/threonine-protein kinase [Planctomycetaceae bacterium]
MGRGGMGIVMRGFDTSLNRHSAIKVLAPELASSAAARKRFSREARSAAAVVHPHVVPIQTVDEHNGLPYLVMPVVEGQSLQQRVEQNGPLSVIETVRIAAQVASGLQAAHEQGLVHRDIKPANVLLENGVERVQITDFGLARAIDDASMTRSGVITGTPQYMSPEQAHGDTIDHRSDLFSLGSLIYFMLAGRSPFRAETTMGVLNRIGNDEPRNLRSINADVPQWLEQIVMKLLSKSPASRFQTAAAVGELLQDWRAHLQQPNIVPCPGEPTALAAGSSADFSSPAASPSAHVAASPNG